VISLKKYILFTLLLSFFSCMNPNKDVDIPENVIPPQEMASIFKDIHLTDAFLLRKKLKVNKNYLEINSYYKEIYAKHGYSRAKIDSSLSFYSKYPELLSSIYDLVLIDLSKMEDTIK